MSLATITVEVNEETGDTVCTVTSTNGQHARAVADYIMALVIKEQGDNHKWSKTFAKN